MLEEHDSILLAYAWAVNDDDHNKLAGNNPRHKRVVNVVIRSSRRYRREADAPATETDPKTKTVSSVTEARSAAWRTNRGMRGGTRLLSKPWCKTQRWGVRKTPEA
jgi:hypothetical protein